MQPDHVKVIRFNFSKEVIEIMSDFSKQHQFDCKSDYKDAWDIWYKENVDIFNIETRRLFELGYVGSIEKKMYHASRYYFREKPEQQDTSDKKKRQYIPLNVDLLIFIDEHIKVNINKTYTPASGYMDFCTIYKNQYVNEITRLQQYANLNKDDCINKIKKTYKNRYFLIINK